MEELSNIYEKIIRGLSSESLDKLIDFCLMLEAEKENEQKKVAV